MYTCLQEPRTGPVRTRATSLAHGRRGAVHVLNDLRECLAAHGDTPHLLGGGVDIGIAPFSPLPFSRPHAVPGSHHVLRRKHVSAPVIAVHRRASFAPCSSACAAHFPCRLAPRRHVYVQACFGALRDIMSQALLILAVLLVRPDQRRLPALLGPHVRCGGLGHGFAQTFTHVLLQPRRPPHPAHAVSSW